MQHESLVTYELVNTSTTGAHIDRWDNGRPARGWNLRRIDALNLQRSSQLPVLAGLRYVVTLV